MHRKQALAYAAAAVMVGGTLVGATTALAGPDTVTFSSPDPAAETTDLTAEALEVEEIGGVEGETVPAAAEAPAADDPDVDFVALDPFETVHWDYDATGHSVRGHPLTGLRDAMRAHGLPDAAGVRALGPKA